MAEAELRGIPFSMSDWADLVASRETVFAAMVANLPPELRAIYRNSRDGPTFVTAVFEHVMADRGLVEFWPFFPGSTATGRCQPKPEKFIFSAPRQFRNVIQALPGRVVIGLDYARSWADMQTIGTYWTAIAAVTCIWKLPDCAVWCRPTPT
jgi:hypothetical protein